MFVFKRTHIDMTCAHMFNSLTYIHHSFKRLEFFFLEVEPTKDKLAYLISAPSATLTEVECTFKGMFAKETLCFDSKECPTYSLNSHSRHIEGILF